MKVGVFCVLLSILPALLLGWVLARVPFRGKILLDGLCHMPLVLPPVVTGYMLLVLFGRRGVLVLDAFVSHVRARDGSLAAVTAGSGRRVGGRAELLVKF